MPYWVIFSSIRSFSTVDSSQIAARVKDDRESSSRSKNPRMQKLIQTADDMDSGFIKLNAVLKFEETPVVYLWNRRWKI